MQFFADLLTLALWFVAAFVVFELAMFLFTVITTGAFAVLIQRGNATARKTFVCAATAGDDIGEFVSLAWRARIPTHVWVPFVVQHVVASLPLIVVPQSVLRRAEEIEYRTLRFLLPQSWLQALAVLSPPDARCAGPFWLHTLAPETPTDGSLN